MQWNEAFPFEFQKKSMETETTTWSGFSNCGKATVGQILVPEEIYKPNTAGLWIWVNHLSKVTLERKIITKVQQVHQFHWNMLASEKVWDMIQVCCSTDLITVFKKTTTWIALQADQIFSVNIWYFYFLNFGCGFWGSFSMWFSEAPASP